MNDNIPEKEKDTKLNILLTDYKVCHDGYVARDTLVPREYHQMLQAFVVLLALAYAPKALHAFNSRIEFFLVMILISIGTLTLIAYAINIEAKASARRALRKRMVDIEKEIEKSFPCDPLQYWKAVVQRKYFAMENIYKQRDPDDPRKEMNSAS